MNPCALLDFWKASRAPLETSSVGSQDDQELEDHQNEIEENENEEQEEQDQRQSDEQQIQHVEDEIEQSETKTKYSSSSNSNSDSSESSNDYDDDDDDDEFENNHHHQTTSAMNDDDDDDENDGSTIIPPRSQQHLVSGEVVSNVVNIGNQGKTMIKNDPIRLIEISQDNFAAHAKNEISKNQFQSEEQEPANDDAGNNSHHRHHDFSAPRQVRAPSSVFWRLCVWSMLIWGVLGTAGSFIFSIQALISGEEEGMSRE